MRKYTYTYFRSLYRIDELESREESWPELVTSFSQISPVTSKLSAPGFGPYLVKDPAVPCWEHRGLEHRTAHRCDHCVATASMLVFDADAGNQDTMDTVFRRLSQEGVRFLAYTTWSHGTVLSKACWRLVVPLLEDIAPADYDSVRRAFIEAWWVPADPVQCSGRSHFYFWPCARDGANMQLVSHDGHGDFVAPPGYFIHHNKQKYPPLVTSYAWLPPEDTSASEAAVATMRDSLQRMMRDDRVGEDSMIRKLTLGVSLAEHGHRNTAMLKAAGYLTWKYPGHSVGTYTEVLRPSLEAMVAEGSHLTDAVVERMVMSGMRKRWAKDQWQDEQTKKSIHALGSWVEDIKRKADEEYARETISARTSVR